MTQQPDPAGGPTLGWLRSALAQLLNVPEHEVATDQPLGELGVDSLTAAEFSLEIEERTGVNAPLERFLGQDTLADIAREMAVSARGADTSPAAVEEATT